MRTDTVNFAAKNTALAKRPRYVIELAFDSANTILWYFTSHTDAALPPGASSILGVIEGMSGTSQTLNPDTAVATIGNIDFKVVDRASIVTTTLGSELVLGRSTRRQRVRVYVGFEGLAWADYTLVQTQLVTEIAYGEGAYKFSCMDIQREMKKDIFELAKTTLALDLSADDTTVEVISNAAFSLLAHGNSYSDAPSATVGYIKVQDEVIRYSGKNVDGTKFTGCTRGALNTRAVGHVVGGSEPKTSVDEYVYLEMPAVKLMYALLTGTLYGQGASLPTAWNLGIPASYVRLADFTGIGADLWDPADDRKGFKVLFDGVTKTDGKKFIEAELALLSGLFQPVYADGALGLRRMSNILAGAAYVKMLDYSNLVSVGDLVHDFDKLHNVMQISWNWEPQGGKDGKGDFAFVNLLIDGDSIAIHGRADPLKFKFRGLDGSIHTSAILAQRFDALRDRYSGPPERIDVKGLPSLNTLEVGDVVRLKPAGVRDFVANGNLDRSFEVQNITMDWITGELGLKLFGSSQAPSVIPATADSIVLSDAWYQSQGTPLSSVLTITGSNPGHVTAGGTLTAVAGDANAAGSIFYYLGALVIDPGVTINLVNTPQIRIQGFFQNNGTINGKGNGLPGAAAITSFAPDAPPDNAGTSGFIGTTIAGGGLSINVPLFGAGGLPYVSSNGRTVVGANPAMPSFNLAWDGTTLSGLPSDLRGTSGSSGTYFVETIDPGLTVINPTAISDSFPGGAGGAGGAGLILISRGFNQGVAAKIDLSGADGLAAAPKNTSFGAFNFSVYPGSGAGGAPGGFLLALDGASTNATGLTEAGFVALQGKTPIIPSLVDSPSFNPELSFEEGGQFTYYTYYVGTGDGTTFSLPSLSGSARNGNRVQKIPGHVVAVADLSSTLASPTNLGLQSGTDQLLIGTDGTVTVRVKMTWTPAPDARVVGYDVESKESTEPDTSYRAIAPVLGQSRNSAWVVGIRDGVNMDFRVRSAGATREVSEWLTFTGYFVIGKTARPEDVILFSIEGKTLSWSPVFDVDLAGYLIRYQPGTSRSWGDAIQLHDGLITHSPWEMLIVPSGPVTIMIKATDTSGNESLNAAYIVTDLGDPFVANVVETFDRKAAGFPGDKTACSVSGVNLVADLITPIAWKPDDEAAAWSTDSSTLAWATVQYAQMIYVDRITFTAALAGSQLTIQYTVSGDPWSIEYRENSAALAWSGDDTRLAWSTDDSTLAWDSPAYLPWPGQITVKNSIYDFRIAAGQANTQGMVSELTLSVDAPDITETLNNVAVIAGGTRLVTTKPFTVFKGVQLTLLNDGGTAITVKQEDLNPVLKPLIRGYDVAGAGAACHVNATPYGY